MWRCSARGSHRRIWRLGQEPSIVHAPRLPTAGTLIPRKPRYRYLCWQLRLRLRRLQLLPLRLHLIIVLNHHALGNLTCIERNIVVVSDLIPIHTGKLRELARYDDRLVSIAEHAAQEALGIIRWWLARLYARNSELNRLLR